MKIEFQDQPHVITFSLATKQFSMKLHGTNLEGRSVYSSIQFTDEEMSQKLIALMEREIEYATTHLMKPVA